MVAVIMPRRCSFTTQDSLFLDQTKKNSQQYKDRKYLRFLFPHSILFSRICFLIKPYCLYFIFFSVKKGCHLGILHCLVSAWKMRLHTYGTPGFNGGRNKLNFLILRFIELLYRVYQMNVYSLCFNPENREYSWKGLTSEFPDNIRFSKYR